MKILLTNFHTGRGGGHVTYLVAIAKALAGRHAIHVATPQTSVLFQQAQAIDGVLAVPMPFPGKVKQLREMWRAARALRALIRRERYDLIHVNGSADHRLVMFATAGLGANKPRIVFTKHNSIAVGSGLATVIRARSATHHVIAVSDFTGDMMRKTPYGHCGITVVKNGVALARFTPVDAERAARNRTQLVGAAHAGKLLIGTVTGFEWYKGTMDMVQALAALPASVREQVHLVVVGLEPDDEQRATIDKLGLAGQITIVGVIDDVRDAIAAFDVGFVLSHAIETVSFACREMMAMGKPVIVSRYAGLPENIDDGVDGWIVEPRNPVALAARIEAIVAARETLPQIGARALARARAEFSDEHFITGTEAVYRKLYETRRT